MPIIASGGLRNGLDFAKCLALDASMCAMAYPFLRHAAESGEKLFAFADTVLAELKSTMFLIGAPNIQAIKRLKIYIDRSISNRSRG